jgi:hypothetical protein
VPRAIICDNRGAVKFIRTKLNIIPITLMVGGLAVLGWGVVNLATAQSREQRPPAQKDAQPAVSAAADEKVTELSNKVDELTKSRDGLKDRLDTISTQLSHAQWLLSIIIAVAGLLTVAQSYFAFLSAPKLCGASRKCH